MSLSFYYFLPSGRKTIMARLWYNGNPIDISTGVKCPLEFVNQKAKGRSHEAQQINADIITWESNTRKKISEIKASIGDIEPLKLKEALKSKKTTYLTHTFQGFLKMYKSLLEDNLIYNEKTGNPLSQESIGTYLATISVLQKIGVDIDFQKYNALSSRVIGMNKVHQEYEDFVIRLKNALKDYSLKKTSRVTIYKKTGSTREYSPKTLSTFVTMSKKIIEVCAERVGIELPSKWKKIISVSNSKNNSDIFVLPVKHTDYIIENYNEIIEKYCYTEVQKRAMQYCFVAILLCPRKRDMSLWDKNNLIQKNGKWWLKYVPNKTKSSSRVTVEVVIPDVLAEMFQLNCDVYGKLMPPVNLININKSIRAIFSRIEMFHEEIQYMKRGQLVKAKICDVIFIHGLRATGISHKLAKNMPELVTKRYSGHTKNSQSWDRYVHVYEDSMMQAHDEYMAKLK